MSYLTHETFNYTIINRKVVTWSLLEIVTFWW